MSHKLAPGLAHIFGDATGNALAQALDTLRVFELPFKLSLLKALLCLCFLALPFVFAQTSAAGLGAGGTFALVAVVAPAPLLLEPAVRLAQFAGVRSPRAL